MKTFDEFLLNEADPPMPPPSGGSKPPPPLPGGGGLPPLPPMGGGGLGLGGPPLGGPSPEQQQKPLPVKKITVGDVWNNLEKAEKNMEKYNQLNLKYLKSKDKS